MNTRKWLEHFINIALFIIWNKVFDTVLTGKYVVYFFFVVVEIGIAISASMEAIINHIMISDAIDYSLTFWYLYILR